LLMRFTYGWADFLIRFAILMAFAPLVFWLVAKRLWWLALTGIITIWLFRGQGFTLAWQLIFNSGIIIGFHWQQIQDKFNSLRPKTRGLIKKSFVALTAITFIFSYASVFVLSLLFHLWGWNLLPHWWQHVAFTWGWINHDIWIYADKWTLAPLRVVLFFIWFPALYWVVRRYERQINAYTKGVFEVLGKNSLYVYTAESLVVFVFKLYVIPPKTSVFQNFLITFASIALVVLMTIGYKRLQPQLNSFKLR
jgi:hypothetical protein